MKALATGQVVLLVLAIITLAVVAYLVYTQYLGGNRQITDVGCRSEAVSICTGCKTCVIGLGKAWPTATPDLQCLQNFCALSENCGVKTGASFTTIAATGKKVYYVNTDFCKIYGIS